MPRIRTVHRKNGGACVRIEACCAPGTLLGGAGKAAGKPQVTLRKAGDNLEVKGNRRQTGNMVRRFPE